jgi:hypothetical protein
MYSSLQRRQLLTLAYSQQFSYPLKPFELYIRLLSDSDVSLTSFLSELQYLLRNSFIVYKNGFLFLPNISKSNIDKLLAVRKERTTFSIKKWNDAYQFVKIAQYIPFISGVAVIGSLSVNNTIKDDDVDFLIVTEKNRLWITRLLVIIFATYLGKRRSFAQEEKNSWCFNLWLEESDIKLPVSSRSIYEAFEVSQTIWIYSKNSVESLYYRSNRWVKKFIFNYKLVSQLNQKKIIRPKFIIQRVPFLSNLLDVFNYCTYIFQYLYMKRHMTREKVSLTHAFFHPRDTKTLIFSRWKKTLLEMLK